MYLFNPTLKVINPKSFSHTQKKSTNFWDIKSHIQYHNSKGKQTLYYLLNFCRIFHGSIRGKHRIKNVILPLV